MGVVKRKMNFKNLPRWKQRRSELNSWEKN